MQVMDISRHYGLKVFLTFCLTIALFTTSFALAQEDAPVNKDTVPVVISPDLTIDASTNHHIPYLRSDITLNQDSSATITEQIYLVIPKDKASLPFTRTIRKVIPSPYGTISLEPQVVKAFYDKDLVPFNTSLHQGELKVTFPTLSTGLDEGVHSFTLEYYLPKALWSLKGQDTFLWDIAGKPSSLSVARTIFSVTHPEGIHPQGQNIFFNGLPDSKVQNRSDIATTYNFLKKEPVSPSDELVLLETFTKGAFTPTPIWQRLWHLLSTNTATFIIFAGLLGVFLYYLGVYFTCGNEKRHLKDPSLSSEHNHFLSSSGLRFFTKGALDGKIFASLTLALTLKGYVKIKEQSNGTFTLIKGTILNNPHKLTKTEAQLFTTLFPKNTLEVTLDAKTGELLNLKRHSIERHLQKEIQQEFIRTNLSYFAFSFVIIIVAIALASYFWGNFALLGGTALVLIVSLLAALSLARHFIKTLQALSYSKKAMRLLTLSIAFIFTGTLASLSVFLLGRWINPAVSAFLCLSTLVYFFFYIKLQSKDKLGKAITQRAELYKHYLEQTTPLPEAITAAPQKALEIFYRHLPFAIATNEAMPFIARFQPILELPNNKALNWYEGSTTEFSETFITGLFSRLSTAFTSTIPYLENSPTRPFKKN